MIGCYATYNATYLISRNKRIAYQQRSHIFFIFWNTTPVDSLAPSGAYILKSNIPIILAINKVLATRWKVNWTDPEWLILYTIML